MKRKILRLISRERLSITEINDSEFANRIDIHHLKSHSKYPELRMMVVNMIPLCKSCHTRLHKALGWVNMPVMAQVQFVNKLASTYGLIDCFRRVA
jgi:hypothetical protein